MTTLDYSRTVPRELVHRAAVAEVFLTSHRKVHDDLYLIGAQLPRFHPFYSDEASSRPSFAHDPLLVLEVCRQAAILLAHQYFEVPADKFFVLRTVAGQVLDPGALVVGTGPTDAAVSCEIVKRHGHGDVVHGLDVRCTLRANGFDAVAVSMSYSWVTAAQWRRIRGAGPDRFERPADTMPIPTGVRADARLVDRRNPFNVVVGPPVTDDGSTRAHLVIDTTHPTLFDHPLDHVPGGLQLEACRQLAIVAARARHSVRAQVDEIRIDGLRARFGAFAELDLPTECEARTESVVDHGNLSRFVVSCVVFQGGRVTTEATVWASVPVAVRAVTTARHGGAVLAAAR
jgi:hypothetical protein